MKLIQFILCSFMICYCLCGCTTQSLNNSNTSNPLECQYNSYIDDNYYILSDKIIYLSHFAKEIKNLNIEINTENNTLEMYYVNCNLKYLVTTLYILSLEEYDLGDNTIQDQKLLDFLGDDLEIYTTLTNYTIVGTKDTILFERGIELSNIKDDLTKEYYVLLDSLFNFNEITLLFEKIE